MGKILILRKEKKCFKKLAEFPQTHRRVAALLDT